eukprot:3416174-Prymnesium_polylepis.1
MAARGGGAGLWTLRDDVVLQLEKLGREDRAVVDLFLDLEDEAGEVPLARDQSLERAVVRSAPVL